MAKIGIIGAGNPGANLAWFIAEQNIAHVSLYDDNKGIATGKALDLMEAAPVRQYTVDISSASMDQLLSSEIICITAGKTLAEIGSVEELTSENTASLQPVAEALQNFPGIVIVMSEPTEVITTFIQQRSRLPWSRVMGAGTVCDTLRLRYLIAKQLEVMYEDVQALVLGTHMLDLLIPEEYITVGGLPLSLVMEKKDRKALVQNLRELDTQHVTLAKQSTAYYSPAAAVAQITEAIVQDSHRLLPVSFVPEGDYGISHAAVGLPSIVSAKGISSILDISLSKEEHKLLFQAAERIMKISGRKA